MLKYKTMTKRNIIKNQINKCGTSFKDVIKGQIKGTIEVVKQEVLSNYRIQASKGEELEFLPFYPS